MSDTLRSVREHYLRQWGRPSREAEFQTDSDKVEILKWASSRNPLGVDMYVTLGASGLDLPGLEQGHRVEFYVGLLPAEDQIASELAALALYPSQAKEVVGHGHTVMSKGTLWPGTAMNTFLILQSREEVIPQLQLERGVHVSFLQVIPIYNSERIFRLRYGPEELLDRWELARVPFWNPRRQQLVS